MKIYLMKQNSKSTVELTDIDLEIYKNFDLDFDEKVLSGLLE